MRPLRVGEGWEMDQMASRYGRWAGRCAGRQSAKKVHELVVVVGLQNTCNNGGLPGSRSRAVLGCGDSWDRVGSRRVVEDVEQSGMEAVVGRMALRKCHGSSVDVAQGASLDALYLGCLGSSVL